MGPSTWPVPGSASHQPPFQVAGGHWPRVRWLVAGCLSPAHGGPASPRQCASQVNLINPPGTPWVKRRWRISPVVLSGAGRNPPGRMASVDDIHRRPPPNRVMCVAPVTNCINGDSSTYSSWLSVITDKLVDKTLDVHLAYTNEAL